MPPSSWKLPRAAEPASKKRKKTPVSAEMKALVADLVLTRGQVALPEAKFWAWEERLAETPKAERKQKAAQLIALVHYFEAKGGPAAARALAQFITLATSLAAERVEQPRPKSKPAVPSASTSKVASKKPSAVGAKVAPGKVAAGKAPAKKKK
jgi:hypothetical protein